MKKTLLGLGLLFSGAFAAQAQNGLEGIIVEKYYVATAADAAASSGTLPVGSVTYRIYADMLPGYKFQALYGVSAHALKIITSTAFYNNEDNGVTFPNSLSLTKLKQQTTMLDSWFSVGAAGSGRMGIPKSEDTDGSIGGFASGVLTNSGGIMGTALTTSDGLLVGSPQSVTFVGFDADTSIFNATSQQGGSFITSDASIASLNGSVGATAANKVLIGQFTTDGVFGFELNIQIGTPSGGTENYVSSNPTGTEISIPSLKLVPNQLPSVSITSPANNANIITGDVVTINATAADSDGSVSQVEFFVDGTSVGVDNSSPYSASYTAVAGSHVITAVATDNANDTKTSTAVNISVANNQAPTVSLSAPATAIVGDVVTINATAADVDGTVASVEFFVNGTSIGSDNTAPFSTTWNAVLGTNTITAKATDNRGLTGNFSSSVTVTVANNIPPAVSITSPAANATYTAPQVVSIAASATDADGSVTGVEFFVNGTSIGTDNTAPYTMDWTSVIGTANITARATDNKNAQTTSSVLSLAIADPNALPYKIVSLTQTCLPTTFALPVAAFDSAKNVIGYDMVLSYDTARVNPTGIINKYNALIDSSYFDVISSNDAVNGKVTISAYFNANAPANSKFEGKGNIFAVEFSKKANFANVDTASFTISNLQESFANGVVTKLAEAGKYITYKDTIFNASLKFWLNDVPVKYNSANPNDYLVSNINGNNTTNTNPSAVAVQPDTLGRFTYNTKNGEAININKDILGTTNVQPVINGADALLARKVLLGDNTFTPSVYQLIAMDVNRDGVVSAGDVSQINQRSVLILPEFKQAWNYNAAGVKTGGDSKDWLFIDSTTTSTADYQISATYPLNDGVGFSKFRVPVVPFALAVPITNPSSCPLIASEVYRGILLGDANGNYATTSSSTSAFRKGNGQKVTFDIANASIKNGYLDVPVSIQSKTAVNALDFALQYNDEKLVFAQVYDNTGKLEVLSHYNAEDKTLRFTSNSLENYDLNQAVVTVRFAVNGAEVSDQDLNNIQAYINGEAVEAGVSEKALGIANISNNKQVKVYPNPASNQLNVELSENGTVQLFDMDGKEVIANTFVNADQKQILNLQHVANGVYTLRVVGEHGVSIQKIVVNK